MPLGVSKSGISVYGQVKVERGGKLLYQSPPEEVKVTSLLHQLYEKWRVKYCWLTAGEDIPPYYRTGELPPHPMLYVTTSIILRVIYRRSVKWLKEHHLPTLSM
jgi:hypothetical protein